ncbi:MAG TPA: long-chain fatty acid--CoA ligase [Humibacter sp.]|nr:long-chain fatty acid--CoA ligase [Humibacter sp.]
MHDNGIGAWVHKRRLKSPDKPALISGDDDTLTYRELAEQVDRLSALLRQQGVRKGDRVAYLGENSPEFLLTLFGAAQLGAVFVPVNTRLAAPEIEHVLRDCGARALIYDPVFATRLALALERLDVPVILHTGAGDDALPGLARLLDSAGPAEIEVEVTLEDPAAIIYTSGTTGKAKGAVLTHGNLTWVSLNTLIDYDVVSTDVALMISPLFHVASLGMGALPVILKGGTIVLERGFEAGRALQLIEQYGVTMLSGVPTTFQLMADHPTWASTDLSTLAKLTCGGSAVPARILNAYEDRGLHFSQGYGMTETSPGATSLAPEMTSTKQGSVGLAHFFTRVRVVDRDGLIAPPGTVGEIEVCGPNVFCGYHGQPESTAATFTGDGWFRTGDLGYLDSDGYLYISDRMKDLIISGGENIYPAEVENLINDLEGVVAVAVIGVPDERWGEVPWAIVTERGGAHVDTASVRSFLDGKIARYKIPVRTIVVDELPRTASGKVRKAELRERWAASSTAQMTETSG